MVKTLRRICRDNMETADSFSNMSKAELLSRIVTEKLTTAAQEILAVLETTVAGYEEEASVLRQEIGRQRRQLEILLQPVVKLERMGRCSTDFFCPLISYKFDMTMCSPRRENTSPVYKNVALLTIKPTDI